MSPSVGDPNTEAAALTQVLQSSLSASARKQLGQAGNLLTADLILVPTTAHYVSIGSQQRLVPNSSANPTFLKVNTSGNGFIVVSKTSTIGQAAMADPNYLAAFNTPQPTSQAILSRGTTAATAISGTKYADNTINSAGVTTAASQYIWNEDTNAVGGPVSTGSNPGGSGSFTPPAATYRVTVSYTFDNADLGPGSYSYHRYRFGTAGGTPPTVHITVSCSGYALQPSDIQGLTVSFGGTSIPLGSSTLTYSFDTSKYAVLTDANAQNSPAPGPFGLAVTNIALANSSLVVGTLQTSSVSVTANPASLSFAVNNVPSNPTLVDYNNASGTTVTLSRSDGMLLASDMSELDVSLTNTQKFNNTGGGGYIALPSSFNGTIPISLPAYWPASGWPPALPSNWNPTTGTAMISASLNWNPSVFVGDATREALSSSAPTTASASITPKPLRLDPPAIAAYAAGTAPPAATIATVANFNDYILISSPTTYNGGTPLPTGGMGTWNVGIGAGWTAPGLPSYMNSSPPVGVASASKNQSWVRITHN